MANVRVYCQTNIDTWRHVKWPTHLAGVPEIGSYVRATQGATIQTKQQDTGDVLPRVVEEPQLQVVGVTHAVAGGEPYVIVELHHKHAKELGWLY